MRATRVVVAVVMLVTMAGAAQADASPTSPDPGFDGDGLLTIHSASHDEAFAAMVALRDGKSLVLVTTQDEPALELYRLRENGSPDPSFGGGDGVYSFALAANYEDVALAVDPHSGKSYITTFLDNGTTSPTTVWRIKANGTLDSAYGGGDGHVVFNHRLVESIVAQPDGKLLMAGNDLGAQTANVWRLKDAGTTDHRFGAAGTRVLSTNTSTEATGIALQRDQRVVVGGDHYDMTHSTLLAYRLSKGGNFDPTFSGDGKAFINPSSSGVTTSTVWPTDVLIRPDGRTVFVAGLNQNDGSFRNTLLLAGLSKSGKPDRAFGKHVFVGISETWGQAALERDGKVIVTGYLPPSPSTTGGVFRFTTKGTLDHSWSGDGVLPLAGEAATIGVGISPSGRVLVGRTVNSGPYDTEVRALRGTRTPTCQGKLATQFGSGATDAIIGTPGSDVLVGLGGNDVLKGFGDADWICGGRGDDKLYGGPGRDSLLGGPGRDILRQ